MACKFERRVALRYAVVGARPQDTTAVGNLHQDQSSRGGNTTRSMMRAFDNPELERMFAQRELAR